MTACVFYNIDPKINELIDSNEVSFYSKKNSLLTIDEYLNSCEDKENSQKNISKLQEKLFPIITEKPKEAEPKKESPKSNDNYSFINDKVYPRLTTEEFFKKLSKDRIKRARIEKQKKIHNWYRYNRENIDELFFKALRTFQDNGVDFQDNIHEMYDHFVEYLYHKS